MNEYLTTLLCPVCGETLVNVTRPPDTWPVYICVAAGHRGQRIFTMVEGTLVAFCALHKLPESRCACLRFGKVLAYHGI